MDEYTRERTEEIRRGEQARALLEDPLLAEAFAVLEQSYIEGWRSTPVMAAQAREHIWAHLKALEQVRAHLTSVLKSGQMSRQQLEELTGKVVHNSQPF
jgi:hypothetical protein